MCDPINSSRLQYARCPRDRCCGRCCLREHMLNGTILPSAHRAFDSATCGEPPDESRGVRSFFAWRPNSESVSLHPEMSLRTRTFASLAALSLLLIGVPRCGGSAAGGAGDLTFSETPVQTVQSNSGTLTIAVQAQAGRAPGRGANAFRYVITNASGAPVERVQVTIAPWMPDMG